MSRPDPSSVRWGFIGAGKMAAALIRGMLNTGTSSPASVVVSDTVEAARAGLAADTGITVLDTNEEVVRRSDVVVIAVKPQSMPQVLEEIKGVITPDHLVISIAAG
ncbi:pyrroline-5-carboxylate reductase family protein, partial [Singulisphaera rosea]